MTRSSFTRVVVSVSILFIACSAPAAPIPGLFNTGVNGEGAILGPGEIDPHYTLIQSADGSAPGPEAFTGTGFPVPPWLAEGPDSRWIAPNTSSSIAEGTYIFRTTFDLTGWDAASASISGQWAVDNRGDDIILNGVSTGIVNNNSFESFASFDITSGFVDGMNTLDFVVFNFSPTPNPGGLRVRMTGNVLPPGTPPAIVVHPQSRTAPEGDPVTFTVSAEGSGPLNYQWRKGDQDIPSATETSLTIQNVIVSDQGLYSVQVSNDFGEATSEMATLTVVTRIPGIFNTGVDDNGVVLPDGSVDSHYVLVVNIDGGGPDAFVHDSTVFPIVTGPWAANSETSKWIGPRFETSEAAGGVYVYEINFSLVDLDPNTAFLQGKWAADNEGTGLATEIVLNGVKTGVRSAPFTTLTDFLISNGGPARFVAGDNTVRFIVENAGAGYTGLRVDAFSGGAESIPPGTIPWFTTHPASRSVRAGDTLTLSAVAAGSGALTYQWRLDGEAITGETSLWLTRDAVTASDAGEYDLVATNAHGSTASNPAVLTVGPSSELSISLQSGVMIGGFVGRRYRVEIREDPSQTEWETLATITLPSDPYLFIDPDSADKPQRVYQVIPE